jgi:hypothetical protein
MFGRYLRQRSDRWWSNSRTSLAQGEAGRFYYRLIVLTKGGYQRLDHIPWKAVLGKADAYLAGSSADNGGGVGQSPGDVASSQPAHSAQRAEGRRPHARVLIDQRRSGRDFVTTMAGEGGVAAPANLLRFLRIHHSGPAGIRR